MLAGDFVPPRFPVVGLRHVYRNVAVPPNGSKSLKGQAAGVQAT